MLTQALENPATESKASESKWAPTALEALNAQYRPLSPQQRIERLYSDFPRDRVMLTSAFAATSAFLLHLVSRAAPFQKVYFIDTGYHFPETLAYKVYLTEHYHLTVEDIRAESWKHDFTRSDQTWLKDPDYCCFINKVEPLDQLKPSFDVWMSGLMSWQTEHRSTLDIFEDRSGILKFYPLIDVTKQQRDDYIRANNLPFHPLVAQGYQSIGCVQCTKPGDDRKGRWNNCPKTECGLHL